MQKWSKGELGIMWLGVGAACVAVSGRFNGGVAVIFIVVGVLALLYGGVTTWQGVRAKREEAGTEADGSTTDGPASDPSRDDTPPSAS